MSEGFMQSRYQLIAHVEMNEHAAKTIETRIAYFYLKEKKKLRKYYQYERGEITREELLVLVPKDELKTVINEEMSPKTIKDIFQRIDTIMSEKEIEKEALLNIIAGRQKTRKEMVVDGYKGFLLLDKDGKPKVAMHLEHVMKRLLDKYNATHEEQLPRITPHVLRHTFCTRMAERGMNPKTLQYLMGHADITVTLNVYTHASYTKVADEMAQITAV